MRWMISYRYVPAVRTGRGIEWGTPMDTVELIDMPAPVFVAKTALKLRALQDGILLPERPGVEPRADKILRVYAALRVPPEMLTPEEADALS